MTIKKLSLNKFRNHSSLTLDNLNETILISGANGAGKTSILEAISLLAPGNGLRKANILEMQNNQISFNDTPWNVHAKLNNSNISISYETKDQNKNSKLIKIDGEKIRQQKTLLEHIKIIWFVPQMTFLLSVEAESRRNFLDRMLCNFYSNYLALISEYKKLVTSRMRMLKNNTGDKIWFSNIEKQIAERALKIIYKRYVVTNKINNFISINNWYNKPQIKIIFKNSIEFSFVEKDEESFLEKYLDHYANNLLHYREKEFYLGKSIIGPHLDDFTINHADNNVLNKFLSTGEQKRYAIIILIAQIMLLAADCGEEKIILLLDDAFAHIDKENKDILMNLISGMPKVQKWITGTNNDLESLRKNLNCTDIIL